MYIPEKRRLCYYGYNVILKIEIKENIVKKFISKKLANCKKYRQKLSTARQTHYKNRKKTRHEKLRRSATVPVRYMKALRNIASLGLME